MGLLDLPGPVFTWVDGLLAGLPPLARLLLWGLAAGAFSMWLYKLISPQERIATSKQQQLAARQRLDAFDGELTEAWPLIRRLLSLSMTQVGRVLGPAVLASLPVLCLLVWMSTEYGHAYPAEAPQVEVAPEPLAGRWVRGEDGDTPRVLVTEPGRGVLADLPVAAPVPVIEKRHWWNVLVGNPAGYLADESRAERVDITLPRQQFLPAGPRWMRGWEVPFFAAVLAASLLLKRLLRIQ